MTIYNRVNVAYAVFKACVSLWHFTLRKIFPSLFNSTRICRNYKAIKCVLIQSDTGKFYLSLKPSVCKGLPIGAIFPSLLICAKKTIIRAMMFSKYSNLGEIDRGVKC